MTPPSVSVTGVTSGTAYTGGVTLSPACTTSDSLSGVATNATLSVTNSGINYTATCSGATDNAGNTAAPVSVSYQVIPAGWTTASLTDSNGNPISGAAVIFRSAGGSVTNATTGSDGTAGRRPDAGQLLGDHVLRHRLPDQDHHGHRQRPQHGQLRHRGGHGADQRPQQHRPGQRFGRARRATPAPTVRRPPSTPTARSPSRSCPEPTPSPPGTPTATRPRPSPSPGR